MIATQKKKFPTSARHSPGLLLHHKPATEPHHHHRQLFPIFFRTCGSTQAAGPYYSDLSALQSFPPSQTRLILPPSSITVHKSALKNGKSFSRPPAFGGKPPSPPESADHRLLQDEYTNNDFVQEQGILELDPTAHDPLSSEPPTPISQADLAPKTDHLRTSLDYNESRLKVRTSSGVREITHEGTDEETTAPTVISGDDCTPTTLTSKTKSETHMCYFL